MTDEEIGFRLAVKNRQAAQRDIHQVGDELNRVGDQAERAGRKSRLAAAGVLSFSNAGKVAARSVLYGTGVVAAGVVGLGAVVGKVTKESVQGWEDHQKVVRQTQAVIKSTGGTANLTARQVGNLSDSLERRTGVDGDVIQSGANMLLTFKNVRDEQGAGNKIFSRSLGILNDMSVAMGSDASKSAIQLGKALNDPVKGVSALSKVGVTFDDVQKKQIANYVKQGKMAQAQKIILRELTSEFGGSARAQMTLGDQVMVGWHGVEDTIGKAVLPLQQKFQRFLIRDGIPAAQHYADVFERRGIPAIAKYAGIFERRALPVIHNLVEDGKPLVREILPAAGDFLGAAADAFGVIAPKAQAVFAGFNALPKWAKSAIAIGVGGAVVGKKLGALDLGKSVLGSVTATKPLPVYVVNKSPIGDPGTGGKSGYSKYLSLVARPAAAAAGPATALALSQYGLQQSSKLPKDVANQRVAAGSPYGGVWTQMHLPMLADEAKKQQADYEAWFRGMTRESKGINAQTRSMMAGTGALQFQTRKATDFTHQLFTELTGVDQPWRPTLTIGGLDATYAKVNAIRQNLYGMPALGSYGQGLGVLAPSKPKKGRGKASAVKPRAALPRVEQPSSFKSGDLDGAGKVEVHAHVHIDRKHVGDAVLGYLEERGARR